jgi:hypothetical protein
MERREEVVMSITAVLARLSMSYQMVPKLLLAMKDLDEVLFQPGFINGFESIPGIHRLTFRSVYKCDELLHRDLC